MKIIPVINCKKFKDVKERLTIVSDFLNQDDFAQIDVADGIYTSEVSWDNPAELKNFLSENHISFNLEVHLMKRDPEKFFEDWFRAGMKRVIVQHDAVSDFGKFFEDGFADGEIGVAFGTKISALEAKSAALKLRHDFGIKFFQVLSVPPGPSGQKFDKNSLEKISKLKEINDIMVEVDGGINLETAAACFRAGADAVCSGNYLFAVDPKAAYEKLKAI